MESQEFSEHGAVGGRAHGAQQGHVEHVHIDGENVAIDGERPTGAELLAAVGKRPCAFELIAEFTHRENLVIEAHEQIDLRQHGLKGFITARKEIVTITIEGDSYRLHRGSHTVAEIIQKAGKSPDGYDLTEEKNGPPLPVPTDKALDIHGCEVFHLQVKSGASS